MLCTVGLRMKTAAAIRWRLNAEVVTRSPDRRRLAAYGGLVTAVEK